MEKINKLLEILNKMGRQMEEACEKSTLEELRNEAWKESTYASTNNYYYVVSSTPSNWTTTYSISYTTGA